MRDRLGRVFASGNVADGRVQRMAFVLALVKLGPLTLTREEMESFSMENYRLTAQQDFEGTTVFSCTPK